MMRLRGANQVGWRPHDRLESARDIVPPTKRVHSKLFYTFGLVLTLTNSNSLGDRSAIMVGRVTEEVRPGDKTEGRTALLARGIKGERTPPA
ncbi:hypothetical protein BT69DRAFT_1291107 [Atractiella rhizophila]|nr:hypothetical protein BT69DRAFT_1291107 [Atractiella rhizophila]